MRLSFQNNHMFPDHLSYVIFRHVYYGKFFVPFNQDHNDGELGLRGSGCQQLRSMNFNICGAFA